MEITIDKQSKAVIVVVQGRMDAVSGPEGGGRNDAGLRACRDRAIDLHGREG